MTDGTGNFDLLALENNDQSGAKPPTTNASFSNEDLSVARFEHVRLPLFW